MQSDTLVVNTPESVDLNLELAGLGSRFLALFIDTLIQGLFLLLLFLAVSAMGWTSDTIEEQLTGATKSTWGMAILLIVIWLVFHMYYMLFELAWRGQTPGKRAVGLRVLDRSGRPATPGALVVRNLVRLVDSLPLGYPVAVVTFLLTRLGQRLGDLAAATVVVRERRLRLAPPGRVPGGQSHVPAGLVPPDPQLVAQYVRPLTQSELDLVRSFLERRRRLRWHVRRELGYRLAFHLARRMGYPHDIRAAEHFLEAVLLARPYGVEG